MHSICVVLAEFNAAVCSLEAFLSSLISELSSFICLSTSLTKAPVHDVRPIINNINKTKQPPQPQSQPFLRFSFFFFLLFLIFLKLSKLSFFLFVIKFFPICRLSLYIHLYSKVHRPLIYSTTTFNM